MTRRSTEPRRSGILAAAAAATAAVVGVATWAAAKVLRKMDPKIEQRTMFGRAFVFNVEDEAGEPVRVLAVGGAVQSGSYLGERRFEAPFEYYRAFDHMFEASIPVRRVLMIGGGAYAWPKHALTTRDDLRLDVAEIDPAITEIARRHFYLDELEQRAGERLRIFSADGRSVVDAGGEPYDAIANDSFAGDAPAGSLLTDEGIVAIKSRLVEGGLYLVNVVCGLGLSRLQATVESLKARFAHVYVIPCTDPDFSDDDNYLVIATDGDHAFSNAIEAD